MSVMLITGASRGIGAATARAAAADGYAVCVNYHSRSDAADALVAEITAAGGQALAVQADVAKEADVMRLFKTVDTQLGALTSLVNNAGILHPQSSVAALSVERLRDVFETNIIGSFLCAREAIQRMAKSQGGDGGTIVNVSSVAAKLGGPNEYVDYAASKGAIDSFTIGLAKEVAADGIRVNAVRPGIIYTDIHASGGEPGRVDRLKDMVPMRRGGDAAEVAAAILWLASEASSYSTGSFIDVSGGR